MADTSARTLKLLSLLQARPSWSAGELAERLGVTDRTVRRDVDVLRELGYPVVAGKGPTGGYRLGAGKRLPPLLFDDEQAVALAVALQTAPASVVGLDDALARALNTVRQVMPAHLNTEIEALHVTAARNSWAFLPPPTEPEVLRAVGAAVRAGHLFRFDYRRPDGRVPDPRDADFEPPRRVEPHDLVARAGQWYLVAYEPSVEDWRVLRVDRMVPKDPTGVRFPRRERPGDEDAGRYVATRAERGDVLAPWPCVGSVLMELPADVVAEWAPAGSVVEAVAPGRCRFLLGAWSWAGVTGLLATFATDFVVEGPDELRRACAAVAARLGRVAG